MFEFKSIIVSRCIIKYLFTFIILCNTLFSFAQIHADFNVVNASGCGPLQISFINNSSTGSDISYYWSFGNGNVSTQFEPYVIFNSTGTFDIMLIVSNGSESDTLIQHQFITVFNNPVADFLTLSGQVGCAPFENAIHDASIQANSAITNYQWDFGDGTVSTEKDPVHTYGFAGIFNVSLIVTDSNGCSGSNNKENYIHVFKPHTFFSSNLKSSCSGNLTATFSNLSTGTAPLSFEWDFGDGSISTERNPVHYYALPGIYSVSLKTIDSIGCSNTFSRNEYINIIDVVAAFTTANNISCKNEIVNFTNTSQNATNYEWNFGDSTFALEKNPSHAYSHYGNYFVTLKVTRNGQCMDSVVHQIVVENIKADFHLNNDFGCELPFYTQFINSSVNAVEWNWRLGSGNISHLQNPIDSIMGFYSLDNSKIFSVTLTAISSHGCIDSLRIDTAITIVLPKIVFAEPFNNSISGCIPQTLNVINQSTYNTTRDYLESWKWDYGNGQTSQSWNGSFTYTNPGNFIVTYTLTTALGCHATATVMVNTGTPQTPMFSTASPDTVCASDIVSFHNLSQNNNLINDYLWDFGDQSPVSFIESPNHAFEDTGFVSVSLSVSYNGCVTTIVKPNLFYVKGPYSKFVKHYDCANPLDYVFIASVKGSQIFYWKFNGLDSGDFNTSQISHTFSGSGDYQVQLIAENVVNGCSFNISKSVAVREIQANFTMSDSVGCPGLEINFNGSISQDETYDTWFNLYKWHFSDNGENIFLSASNGLLTRPFNMRGEQSISLTVQDINGCTDTKIKNIKIYQPEVNFYAAYQTGCLPVNFIFYDSTLSDTTIASYFWHFGDSLTSSEQNPIHQYNSFGLYDISLKVMDILGCSNEFAKFDYICAVQPNPAFLANDPTRCKGDTIFFAENSNTEIASYFWDFGDGSTTTDSTPFHVYADTGLYTVSLYITDVHGCDTTGIVTNFVSIQQPPIVDFYADALSSNCYPFPVQFDDLSSSTYLSSWLWNFGDNYTASEMQNPSHSYFKPGTYNVTLIAYTSNGCSDTITKDSFVMIKGPWARIDALDTVCRGDTVTMFVTEKTNIYGFKWDLGNGMMSVHDTVSVVYDSYGSIFPSVMLYSDSNHVCDKVITDTINVFELIPNFSINNGQNNGCTPYVINCNDISANADSISWYLDNIFQIDQNLFTTTLQIPGNYTLKQVVWNHFGCYDSLSKNIIVFPLPTMQISDDTLICRDQNVQLLAKGGINYSWNPTTYLNNSNISNPIATPDSSTKFTVIVEDLHGCIDDTSMVINVFQRPQIIMRDTAIVVGEYVQLNALNAEIQSYNWSPTDGLSCITCYNPIARPLENTTYNVAVTDTHNCFTIDYAVQIDILKKYSVDVPELFTPNGDGKNDAVFVRGWGIKALLEFRIFNRWGEMVFETNDVNQGWDGTYKGEMQNTETFMFTVRTISFNNEILSKKGFIKLIR